KGGVAPVPGAGSGLGNTGNRRPAVSRSTLCARSTPQRLTPRARLTASCGRPRLPVGRPKGNDSNRHRGGPRQWKTSVRPETSPWGWAPMRSLARWSYRHRRLVVLGWLLALVGITLLSKAVGTAYSNDF